MKGFFVGHRAAAGHDGIATAHSEAIGSHNRDRHRLRQGADVGRREVVAGHHWGRRRPGHEGFQAMGSPRATTGPPQLAVRPSQAAAARRSLGRAHSRQDEQATVGSSQASLTCPRQVWPRWATQVRDFWKWLLRQNPSRKHR